VIRFERLPYEVKNPAFINAYLRYDGINPARMRGYYKVYVVHSDGTDFSAKTLEPIEDKAWDQFVASIKSPDHCLMIEPKSNIWVTLKGEVLTSKQINDLSKTKSSILLFMGMFKWIDGFGDYEVDYCAFTQENPEVFMQCANHNEPVRPGSAATLDSSKDTK
jgi:hypothetical protein